MTSAVQIRGSIPLSWSQKPAFLNLRPRFKVSALNDNSSYQATQLHFINLHRRYRLPIIILNLVKNYGNENILGAEFRRAVDCINMVLPDKDQLKFLRFDLDTVFRTKGIGALKDLKDTAASALEEINFFSCQMPQSISFKVLNDFSDIRSSTNCTSFREAKSSDGNNCKLQKGILRTNCIDSLDRTNIAQYAYGLVALGHQLHALDINESPNLDLNHGLANELMIIYEAMGDALAYQYGGSAAQNKIFAEFRGQCKLATRFLQFTKKVQRHFSNSFRDFDKQKAIDIFLGPFQQEVDESPPSRSDSHLPKLQRTASDSEVLHKMLVSDLGYLSTSPGFSTPRWCAPVGQLRFDPGSPYFGHPYFRSTGNYFTDTDEAGALLWSESEFEQEPYESDFTRDA